MHHLTNWQSRKPSIAACDQNEHSGKREVLKESQSEAGEAAAFPSAPGPQETSKSSQVACYNMVRTTPVSSRAIFCGSFRVSGRFWAMLPQPPTPSPESSFFTQVRLIKGHPFSPAVGSHQHHPSILSAPMESEPDPASPSLWKHLSQHC